MKLSTALLTLCAVAVLASCSDKGSHSRPVVGRVDEILSDRNGAEYKLLSQDSKPDRGGAIFVLGEERDCEMVSEELANCDYRDNVDGTFQKDGLPDFCGERICSICDFAGGEYFPYLSAGAGDSLRTRLVDISLLALDTLCYVSPYDLDGLVSQPRAKIIVLASSIAYQYGLYDVDSLFRGSSCGVSLVNPLSLMKKAAFDEKPGAVGVISFSQQAVSAGLYGGAVAFAGPGPGADCLTSFLDSYVAAGHTEPLKALIVDDWSVDCSALEASLEKVKSVMNAEFLVYSPLLTDDFHIIDPRRTLSSECVQILRSTNMFTHLILRPRREKYMTVSRPELVLIPYNERYAGGKRDGI